MSTIKISAGFSGVISKGAFENARPSYNIEYEFDGGLLDVAEIQKDLRALCQARFREDETALIVERITRERNDIRFYDGLPSVTSVINWDADFFVSPQELQEYASHGNLYHAQATHFIQTGEWKSPQDIEGTWTDLVIIKKGKLGLEFDDWNFPAFLKKYPFEKMVVGKVVMSKKYAFAGTPDVLSCIYDGKKTLADFKRTPDKPKNFKQIAAYIIASEEMGESPYEQMAIIPANGKTEQGFSKPILSTEIEQYKKMFLADREAFKKRFGI